MLKTPGLPTNISLNFLIFQIMEFHVRVAAGDITRASRYATGASTNDCVVATAPRSAAVTTANWDSAKGSASADIDDHGRSDNTLSMDGVQTKKHHRQSPIQELHGETRTQYRADCSWQEVPVQVLSELSIEAKFLEQRQLGVGESEGN